MAQFGGLYRRLHRPKDALFAYERAATYDTVDAHSHFNEGVLLLWEFKDPEAALNAVRQASERDPSHPDYYHLEGHALSDLRR